MGGLWMLVAQAKEASEWFTDSTISDEQIGQIHAVLRAQMENIILIGMPGCGKSTVGTALAAQTGRKLMDADTTIAQRAGKSIPAIFAEDGEAVFRALETEILAELGKQSGLVIATGGGCVTHARNYPLLHQNGTVFWLKRDLDLLPTQGRPLSQQGKLADMYAIRKPMYEHFADLAIDNNDSVESAVQQVLMSLQTGPQTGIANS